MGGDRSTTPQGLSPEAAFALVGNEHRVRILRALLTLHRTGRKYPGSFSTLRSVAEIDVSAQFNYHLRELTDHYLEKTEDGYAFRVPGWEIATAIMAGTYTDCRRMGDRPIDGTCPCCRSAALHATYRDAWVSVACENCEATLTRLPFPPGAWAGRSLDGFLEAFDSHVRTRVPHARDVLRLIQATRDRGGTRGSQTLRVCSPPGDSRRSSPEDRKRFALARPR